MNVSRLWVVAAIVLALAVPAWANNLNTIIDPIPSPAGGGQNLYYLTSNGPWSVSWQTCNSVLGTPPGPLPPSGPGSEFIGDPACLGFANYTGAGISNLSLVFTVSGALDGLTLTCSNADSYLGTNNCASYSSPLTDGEVVALTFSAPTVVPVNYDFFFAVTTTDSNGNPITIPGFSMPDSGILLPTYDPSTLVLLATGLGLLGLGGVRRRVASLLAS